MNPLDYKKKNMKINQVKLDFTKFFKFKIKIKKFIFKRDI